MTGRNRKDIERKRARKEKCFAKQEENSKYDWKEAVGKVCGGDCVYKDKCRSERDVAHKTRKQKVARDEIEPMVMKLVYWLQ